MLPHKSIRNPPLPRPIVVTTTQLDHTVHDTTTDTTTTPPTTDRYTHISNYFHDTPTEPSTEYPSTFSSETSLKPSSFSQKNGTHLLYLHTRYNPPQDMTTDKHHDKRHDTPPSCTDKTDELTPHLTGDLTTHSSLPLKPLVTLPPFQIQQIFLEEKPNPHVQTSN